MTVIGGEVLARAGTRDAPLRKWLMAWAATVESAKWESIANVRKFYPSADGIKLVSRTVVTVFNVKGNNYRLLTWIDYDAQVVEALEVISHAEHDKEQWKARY